MFLLQSEINKSSNTVSANMKLPPQSKVRESTCISMRDVLHPFHFMCQSLSTDMDELKMKKLHLEVEYLKLRNV
jgi:hypothetical protein